MRFYLYIIFCLVLTSSCKFSEETTTESNSEPMEFYVGTYTDAESEGIYKYQLTNEGHIKFVNLAARSDNPSFLTMSKDKQYLLAVNEIGEGRIESFSIDGDSLTPISSSASGGSSPCYITINDEGLVLAANYSSGTISLLQLDNQGRLSKPLDIQQHSGEGTTSRQQGPHAHSVYFAPKNNEVVSVDLGTNELWFFELDEKGEELKPIAPYKLVMESGAGPRHLDFHPSENFLYVLNELNSTVSVIEKTSDSEYKVRRNYTTLPDDFKGENYGADIHISSDGKFLYTSNRGHNSIAIFAIENGGDTLRLIDTIHVEGDWPRNFSLSPDERFLIVANQYSNNLVSFMRNQKTGKLDFLMSLDAPTPVNVLFP